MVEISASFMTVANDNTKLSGGTGGHLLLGPLLLLVLVVAVYWPVRTHGYMGADDYFYVVDNVHAHTGLNWPTVKWAFTAMNMGNWIPLTWLSHTVDYSLFGADPAGHHIVNVLLHALAAMLLFGMLKSATGLAGRSFMVAALFALHPINVEPVAWVAELKTMLSMVFFVLALAAYRWYASKPSIAGYAVVAALYALGLMAKPQVIMLPVLLLLWDYWPLQRWLPSGATVEGTNSFAALPAKDFVWLVKEKLPLVAMALLDAAVTLHVQGVARPERWQHTWWVRLQNAAVAYVRYIAKALWPQWLAIYYPHPGDTLAWWQVARACMLLVWITALVFVARRHRYLAVGWFWFLISLFPMSGILHFGDQAMADRYAYEPLVGLFMMFCWGVAELWGWIHVPHAMLRGSAILVLVVLTVMTRRQVGFWSDNIILWSHVFEVSKDNVGTEDVLGFELMQRGRQLEALQHFHRSVILDPADPAANLQLAFYEHQYGDLHRAAEYYEKVVLSPHSGDAEKRRALINLGHVYGKLGEPDRARQCFEAAAKIPEKQTENH